MNYKDQFQDLFTEYLYSDEDAANAAEFASKVLDLLADKTEDDSPHAVNAIRRYRDVSRELSDWSGILEEFGGE